MTYLNTHSRTSKPTATDMFRPSGRSTPLFGVYMGYIKDSGDVQKNGRLRVWIPELGSAPDNQDGWIIVNYCSPFAGATNVDSISQANTQSFEGTQTSYGMWMIPPDINNIVAVMFLNGDPSRGIWIGCLLNQYMNNMIPGMASDTNNYQYQGKDIPVAEYNKWDSKVNGPDTTTRPYEATKFNGLGNQGLINDPIRGVTSSSARRESPSNVYGILTPGPIINSNLPFENVRRKGGHSFIMDDGEGSEYIQLATKSGAQIKIDETNGFVYLINRDGTAWVQMDKSGNIDIFGAGSISMRAQNDFNIRADGNVNIEAGQNVFIKAAQDTKQSTTSFTYDVNNKPTTNNSLPVWSYVGEGEGTGGDIVMQALNNWQSTTQNSAFLTVVENNLSVDIGNALTLTTQQGGQDYNSALGIKMSTNGAFDLAANGNIRASSNALVSVTASNDIVLCTSSNLNLKSTGSMQIASAGDILTTSDNFEVTATSTFTTLNVSNVLSAAGTSNLVASGAIVANSLGSSSPPSVSPPTSANPAASQPSQTAATAQPSEVKPLNQKINILATWADSKPSITYVVFSTTQVYQPNTVVQYTDSSGNVNYYSANITQGPGPFNSTNWTLVPTSTNAKFIRNSQSMKTTVSRLATYEPCPEHTKFKTSSISGYVAPLTADDNSYQGSTGAGNDATNSPPAPTAPGSNNTDVQGDPPSASSFGTDVNLAALKCQLSIHEGIKYTVYLDSVGLPTAGIGHLLRTNEISQFPVGAPVSADQVNIWYQADSASAITIAQNLVSNSWSQLSDIRKRAVCDLAYNLGKGRLSKFTQFLAAMNNSDFNTAASQLRDSKWFTQVGRRGTNIITMISQDIDPLGCNLKFPNNI